VGEDLNDFVKRVCDFRLSKPLNDFADPTFKSTIHSLVKSYQISHEDTFALEVLEAHEVLFIKQAKRVNNYHDREDLIIFLLHEFYRVLEEFDPTLSSFSNLLTKRLAWSAGKFFEREMLDKHVLLDSVEYEPIQLDEPDVDDVMSFEAYQMLDCLSIKERYYIEDVVISGLSMNEFKKKRGITGNARMIKKRAIEKLAKAYTEVYKDGLL
jgi:hypothetical protein